MKFAHLADCHLGGWKDPKLEELNLISFIHAFDKCIQEKVDFILIAGDLFDNALPSVDVLKQAAAEFRKLKEAGIKCYIIQGSHDYSLSGKSFVDVLESAGLCINVRNGYESDNLIIYGIEGKKAGLEKNAFNDLKINLEKNDKVKIFMLHTTLTEVKPRGMEFVESTDAKNLPDGFDYYAAGHIHIISELDVGNKKIVYPGPLFPNNIQELEELGAGSFYIIETSKENKWKIQKQIIKLKEILPLTINLEGKDAKISTDYIINEIQNSDINDKIIILRLKGCFSSGKTADIDFKKVEGSVKDCYTILRNTKELETPEFKSEIKTESKDINTIEEEALKDYIEKSKTQFTTKTKELMNALSMEKQEGELAKTFQSRLISEVSRIIDIT